MFYNLKESEDSKQFVYKLLGDGGHDGSYTREELEGLGIVKGTSGVDSSLRKELHNQPKLEGYLGPMYDGIENGKHIIRYETQDLYDKLSN